MDMSRIGIRLKEELYEINKIYTEADILASKLNALVQKCEKSLKNCKDKRRKQQAKTVIQSSSKTINWLQGLSLIGGKEKISDVKNKIEEINQEVDRMNKVW